GGVGMGIIIDGVDLPTPSRFKIMKSDIDSPDSDLNELGIYQRDRVRQDRYSIKLEYHGGTSSEIHTVEAAIETAEINVTFPSTIGMLTKKMFVDSRDGPDMIRHNKDYNKIIWKLNLVLTES